MWSFIAIGVSALLSLFTKPSSGSKPKPQAMTTDSVPLAKDGTTIPIAFGQVKKKDFVVFWMQGYDTRAIKQKGGKK